MNFTIQRSQLEKLFAQRNGYLLLAACAIIVCILQVIVMFFLIGREKVIFVPPSIEKSFWVSSQNVSPEYLSEMTIFFTNLRINMTPESAAMQRDTLLRYIDPSYYGSFKSQLVKEADLLNEQHISVAFYPINVRVDQSHFKALIEGDVKSFVGDATLPTKRVKYLITYRYDFGRLLIKSFEEVKNA